MSKPRKGLLDLEALTSALTLEEDAKSYTTLRERCLEGEPVLKTNLEHWVKVEVDRMKQSFPKACPRMYGLVAHLLERYFVRGYYLQKKAYGLALDGLFEKPCEDPPGHEK